MLLRSHVFHVNARRNENVGGSPLLWIKHLQESLSSNWMRHVRGLRIQTLIEVNWSSNSGVNRFVLKNLKVATIHRLALTVFATRAWSYRPNRFQRTVILKTLRSQRAT